MPALATPSIKAKLERIEMLAADNSRTNSIHWMCTNCKEKIYRSGQGDKTPEDYLYCPFCGARFE
jgi:predicted RNA-binding Zn-ribbon protein involved in translation (DUF1610 family)